MNLDKWNSIKNDSQIYQELKDNINEKELNNGRWLNGGEYITLPNGLINTIDKNYSELKIGCRLGIINYLINNQMKFKDNFKSNYRAGEMVKKFGNDQFNKARNWLEEHKYIIIFWKEGKRRYWKLNHFYDTWV